MPATQKPACRLLPLAAAALLLLTQPAQAQTVNVGVLNFNYGPINSDVRFFVGPAAGEVVVFGVPNVADGTRYTGVRAINWTSAAGDDRLVFDVQQANDFDISVVTTAGYTEIDLKWMVPSTAAAPITPSFSLVTGAGHEKIQVQLESFGRQVDFGVRGDFGSGNTELKAELQYKRGSVDARSNVALNFGSGYSKAEMLVDSEAQTLDLDIAPRNANEFMTKVQSDDPSRSARVRFAPFGTPGGSKLGFEMLTAAQSVAFNHHVTGGAGLDDIKLGLTTLAPTVVSSQLTMALANSNDKLELLYNGLSSTRYTLGGNIDLGGGDDEAKLVVSGPLDGNLLLDCNAGFNDKGVDFPLTRGCELR